MKRAIQLLCVLGILELASSTFGAISIFNGYTDAFVYDGSTYVDSPSFNTSGANQNATLGGYSSTTSTVYSTSGDTASFTAAVAHVRQGDFSGEAYSQIQVDFVPANGGTYTAAGVYLNSSGYTLLSSYLFDSNTSSYLYNSSQESLGGPASFTLGGTSGNYNNNFTGSLTGSLVPGDSYTWAATIFTVGFPDADAGASPEGSVSLSIAPVPENSSAVVWSLLGLVVGATTWWMRRSAAV